MQKQVVCVVTTVLKGLNFAVVGAKVISIYSDLCYSVAWAVSVRWSYDCSIRNRCALSMCHTTRHM